MDRLFQQLESAIARWNAKASGAYPALRAASSEAAQALASVKALLGGRRVLSVPLLTARMKMDAVNQTPEQRAAAVQSLLDRVARLEEALDNFDVEAQTLVAQANRVVRAATPLVEDIAHLHGESPPPPPAPPAPDEDAESAEARIAALLAENARLRGSLDAAMQADGAPPVPHAVQEELARLRAEIAYYRQLTESGQPAPMDRAESLRGLAVGPDGKRRPMGRILVDAGVISEGQLQRALEEQQNAWNRHLGAILVGLGFTEEETIAQTLAAQVQLPYVRAREVDIQREAGWLISGQLARRHSCLPYQLEGESLVVAMANPLDLVALEDLELAARRPIKPVVATASDINAALRARYPLVPHG